MIRPTPEQLAILQPMERFWYTVADFCLRHLMPLCILWNRIFMVHLAWFLTGPRMRIHGREHLEDLGPTDRLVVVANHRSFFDFYAIGRILYTETRLSKRILFPVRAPFYYDTLLGGIMNAIMSGFFMFPPILRDPKRRAFTQYSMDRVVAELSRPGQLLGVHPEGTRCKDPDPYTFLRTQPGVGQILLHSPATRALPVYVTGLSNSMITEFRRNWMTPWSQYPVDVLFGAPIEFDDIREQGTRLTLQMAAANRCMDAVQSLAEAHRAMARGEE